MAETIPCARWRALPGWEGLYEVSDQGHVRSIDRIVMMRNGVERRCAGVMMRQSLAGKSATSVGHMKIQLSRDGVARTRYVHQLVLETFAGPRPPGMEGCHSNGDGTDNRLSNLRWDTPSANKLDSVQHGTHCKTRISCCPRSHRLIPPNLRNNPDGHRRCLACLYAFNIRKNRPDESAPFDFDAVADEQYRLIMARIKIPNRRQPPVRLTAEQVSAIGDLLTGGLKQDEIGARFGVGRERISRIKRELKVRDKL